MDTKTKIKNNTVITSLCIVCLLHANVITTSVAEEPPHPEQSLQAVAKAALAMKKMISNIRAQKQELIAKELKGDSLVIQEKKYTLLPQIYAAIESEWNNQGKHPEQVVKIKDGLVFFKPLASTSLISSFPVVYDSNNWNLYALNRSFTISFSKNMNLTQLESLIHSLPLKIVSVNQLLQMLHFSFTDDVVSGKQMITVLSKLKSIHPIFQSAEIALLQLNQNY
ncbi:MAG: hypothetical protein HQK50_06595 [Oligoflexia bacterium]|nr:hypothetical protein [Oligoflexia bacterium]MBF0365221.1 hypothetical protein [Oligoflexia bacterium]